MLRARCADLRYLRDIFRAARSPRRAMIMAMTKRDDLSFIMPSSIFGHFSRRT